MNIDIKLFGDKKITDWKNLKVRMDNNDFSVWGDIIQYLDLRLQTRYFDPIDIITAYGQDKGEGFAIMTIICSLVEFLESCCDGRTYVHGAKETEEIYSKSAPHFIRFLTTKAPFSDVFTQSSNGYENLADDIYRNVRCGLFHEAATKNNWIIKTTSLNDLIVETKDEFKILYRNNFYKCLTDYYAAYKELLLADTNDSKNLRTNLVKKLDKLSNT